MSLIWLRHEFKHDERRTPITPAQVGILVAAGHEVTVESSPTRVFPDAAYRDHGAEIVAPGTWHCAPDRAFILGIKEVLQEEIAAGNLALKHRHIYFAHVYKGQRLTPMTMRRFALGGGTLLDLEYLVDAHGRRVATFSYAAGFAGAIAAVYVWAKRQLGVAPPYALPREYLSRQEFIDELRPRLAQIGRRPTALVIGANGRSGRGATDLLEVLGIPVTKWGRADTRAGGPFPAILDFDLMCNCVYLDKPGPPFLTREMVTAPAASARLAVVADVSHDLTYNPIFGLDASTNFSAATVRIGDVDVIEIGNLPTLTPLDSSIEYSGQLFPYLLDLIAGDFGPDSIWERALLTYCEHHDIPQLALDCGQELAELSETDPAVFSVPYLKQYFAGLFAKNPLTRTDRLYFVDHLQAGAAERLDAPAQEMFAASLAKADLDAIYDSPVMAAHHALLRAVYGFSRSGAFREIVGDDVRDDYYDLCDHVARVIDRQEGAVECFELARQSFLRKLGPRAGEAALATFLDEVQHLMASPQRTPIR